MAHREKKEKSDASAEALSPEIEDTTHPGLVNVCEMSATDDAKQSEPATEFYATLPANPSDLREPYIFLSDKQKSICAKYTALEPFSNLLPGWIPQRYVAKAKGFSMAGMNKAMASLNGECYVWATELENVHSMWHYDEPGLIIDGKDYSCSEHYYHAQKPTPFDAPAWDKKRVDVMRTAVRAKFAADRGRLCPILMATKGYHLLAVKGDTFWGFDPQRGGENMLAKLWEELRTEEVEADGKTK